MLTRGVVAITLGLAVLESTRRIGPAAEPPDPEQGAAGRVPPGLSFVDGQASFWPPGAQDWVQAQVNTPWILAMNSTPPHPAIWSSRSAPAILSAPGRALSSAS